MKFFLNWLSYFLRLYSVIWKSTFSIYDLEKTLMMIFNVIFSNLKLCLMELKRLHFEQMHLNEIMKMNEKQTHRIVVMSKISLSVFNLVRFQVQSTLIKASFRKVSSYILLLKSFIKCFPWERKKSSLLTNLQMIFYSLAYGMNW